MHLWHYQCCGIGCMALVFIQDLSSCEIPIHYEKIKWFATSLATRFLSCIDHLQLHFNSMYFYNMNFIGQVAWVVANATHCICMQFLQFSCHYVGTTIVQFQCNHFATAIVMSCWRCFSYIHQWWILLISIAIPSQLWVQWKYVNGLTIVASEL